MPIILGANSATVASGGNASRWNLADSTRLYRTPGSASDTLKWTWAAWVKLAPQPTNHTYWGQTLFCAFSDASNYTEFAIQNSGLMDYLNVTGGGTDGRLTTSRKSRDPSAWAHYLVVWDSANASAGDRMKMYINGVEVTAFSADINPSSSLNSFMNSNVLTEIGSRDSGSQFFNGYMADVCFIDGLALTPTSFGEFDTDSPTMFKPINVSGLTFGTNGFYLDFKDSSDLGNDAAGSNNLTSAGFTAADQATDEPTTNFCVVNPLDNYYAASTFSEGNCKISTHAANKTFNTSTMALSSGKWYWEIKYATVGSSSAEIGIASVLTTQSGSGGGELNDSAGNYEYRSDGTKGNANSNTAWGNTWNTPGDIIGVALDLTNLKLYFSKNGVWQESGDPTSGASGTGAAFTVTAPASQTLLSSLYAYTPALGEEGAQTDVFEVNFGGCSAFDLTTSPAETDADGYGNFEFAPPSGYFAICTKNLAEYG